MTTETIAKQNKTSGPYAGAPPVKPKPVVELDPKHDAILKQVKRPLNKRVLILRDEGEEMWGNIHLSEEGRRKLSSGVIIAMADDCEIPAEIGNHVAFMGFAGTEMEIGALGQTQSVVVMRETDLTMVLADDAKAQQGEKVMS